MVGHIINCIFDLLTPLVPLVPLGFPSGMQPWIRRWSGLAATLAALQGSTNARARASGSWAVITNWQLTLPALHVLADPPTFSMSRMTQGSTRILDVGTKMTRGWLLQAAADWETQLSAALRILDGTIQSVLQRPLQP